ncbi:unnamed protein product, partial [Onchocerca ochengi]
STVVTNLDVVEIRKSNRVLYVLGAVEIQELYLSAVEIQELTAF